MTRWDWEDCICISWVVILLKNAPSLSILTRHSKNSVLTGTMWNIINPNGVSKVIDSINTALPIPNINLADSVIFPSSWTKVSSYCNAFSGLIPPVDQVKISKSMSNSLNSVALYCKSVDKLMT